MSLQLANLCAADAATTPQRAAFSATRRHKTVILVAYFHEPGVVTHTEIAGNIKGFVGGCCEVRWVVKGVGVDPPVAVAWIKCEVVILAASGVRRVKLAHSKNSASAHVAPSCVVGESDNALLNCAVAVPQIRSIGRGV